MRIITNQVGRVNQNWNPDEVLPIEGFHIPEAMRLVCERYGFSQVPDPEDVQTKGAVFKNGRLVSGTNKINVIEMGFFNDGVFATAQDTTKADFIVDDLITWAEQVLGLRSPITEIPKKYDNAVVVEFETDIGKHFSVLDGLIHSYSEALSSLYDQPISTSFSRVDFGFDPTEVNLAVGTRFTIERRLGSPFSSNRYHCVAPLKTETHIELLEKFESSLG